ncbi:diacylglycerol kinase family protein [Salinicoccus kekensis]|uniref:Undecaprenol kinase n=1 Tax=Salinicoccus kekensis TaxID=714307 RepID=A0A285U9S8_9STAP|nr:diacylglycerol kinase family protein [Salinicoccus kekensis]SOC38582.1 undecaprenol kinase [Salinicoccus kekensis]
MKRFKYALQGIRVLFGKDHHFAVHLLFALIVAAAGFLFGLNTLEWLFIIGAVFIVLISEVVNTSLEYTVDLVTDEFHELAKRAKDTSALAVLLASLYAAITGLIIFIPKIIVFFT